MKSDCNLVLKTIHCENSICSKYKNILHYVALCCYLFTCMMEFILQMIESILVPLRLSHEHLTLTHLTSAVQATMKSWCIFFIHICTSYSNYMHLSTAFLAGYGKAKIVPCSWHIPAMQLDKWKMQQL